jgi:hypothetical protein
MHIPNGLETPMVMGKPAPFVSAFVDAVGTAIRTHQPQHALSGTQRTWLAVRLTAVRVTNSMCWARFARTSLGTYTMAALSWMFRHSKMPWEHLLVASVRVILRHHGITAGPLVVDNTDNPRSKSAKALAYLYTLRDKAGGGYLWEQSPVLRVLVTPKISLPVGVVFYQPASELSAWDKTDKSLKKQNKESPKTATAQTGTEPAVSYQRTTRPALTRILQDPSSRCPDVRGHGGCALWHGGLRRWGIKPVQGGTNALANPEQSEHSSRREGPARRRLLRHPSWDALPHPHPGR